ncbi:uncharacterized protein LOC128271917 [Anopheles cruzii]|uniref:uncharacterized protein LOC128271917 n=1 Tax=Anopheles cruzii TaxID=68878 RepID=UPI0022EC2E0D|nr:uncharacterized protein LOC128271917 [Anopheles cruzii]
MGRSHSKEQQQQQQQSGRQTKADPKKKRKRPKADGSRHRKSRLSELREPDPPPVVHPKGGAAKNDYDLEAKRRMQHQLAFNSDIFVLNQLMLGVQFYGNFEREMWEAVERNRAEENRRNGRTSRHCKTVILPDRLLEAVDKRVKFYAKHGPHKNRLLPLHTQTCYIVHDNIEITNPGDSSVYSILTDAPIYKLEIEDGLDDKLRRSGMQRAAPRRGNCHHGYVKLRSVEYIKPNEPPPVAPRTEPIDRPLRDGNLSDSDTLEDDDDDDVDDDGGREGSGFRQRKFRDSIAVKYPKMNGVYGAAVRGKVRASTTVPSTSTSSTSPPSSEYDYAYITAINTHQPLSVMRSAGAGGIGIGCGGGPCVVETPPLSTTVLPDYCITTLSCPIEVPEGYYSDDEESEGQSSGSGGKPAGASGASAGKHRNSEYTTERRQYLNSKGFLAYFVNLFQDRLAAELDIPADDLPDATWKGAVVYSGHWEIVPAVFCPWPREATEWVHRKRDVKVNPLTKQRFQWPTPPMIQKVRSFGCHVVPVGYAPKQGQNRYRQLEWKIVFPEAERYLESCLSSTQVKLYLVAKLLLKTFVETAAPAPAATLGMFGLEHLRAHLFWQCETNYAAWPEDYLGEALLRFLNALLERIKTHRLPDYFLPARNLFENVPERVLVELHRRIFRVTENPAMHLLVALRNLKLPSGTLAFYPKLRLKRLYAYLAVDNPLRLVNPLLRDEDENLAAEDSDEQEANEREIAVGSMAYYHRQEIESRRKRTRIVRFLVAEQLLRKDRAERPTTRRASIESIDLTFLPLKHMENLRRQLIYGHFIEHFTEMARVSCRFRALNQALVYVRQSERLCDLLADDEGADEAHQYLAKIGGLRQELARASAQAPDRPALPRRTSSTQQQPMPSQRPSHRPTAYSNVPTSHQRNQRQVSVQVHPRDRARRRSSDDIDDISRLLGNVTVR